MQGSESRHIPHSIRLLLWHEMSGRDGFFLPVKLFVFRYLTRIISWMIICWPFKVFIEWSSENSPLKGTRTGKEAVSFITRCRVQICRVVATEQASHDTWLTKVAPRLLALWAGVTVILSVVMKRCCKGFSRKRCMICKRVSMDESQGTRDYTLVNESHCHITE